MLRLLVGSSETSGPSSEFTESFRAFGEMNGWTPPRGAPNTEYLKTDHAADRTFQRKGFFAAIAGFKINEMIPEFATTSQHPNSHDTVLVIGPNKGIGYNSERNSEGDFWINNEDARWVEVER
jgi:hypothetical protein